MIGSFEKSDIMFPRESGKFIAERSKDVKIDLDGVKNVADKILKCLQTNEYSITAWKKHELHPKTMSKETVDWIFLMDTLNFSFWSESNDKRFLVEYKGEKHSGYWSLCAAIKRAVEEGIPLTSPTYYANMTLEDVKHVFRSATDTDLPLLEKRWEHLQEAGRVLNEKFNGTFVTCVEQCGKSAKNLLKLVTENFTSYKDETVFAGTRVSFYKRAQILIADIWACFEGRTFGEFNDIDFLTMFADYRVPQSLNFFGALQYSDDLMRFLHKEELLMSGDRLEVEIRGCSIHAIELISSEIKKRMKENGKTKNGLVLNSVLIDFYLWDYCKDHWKDMKHIPIHKIRCGFY